MVGTNAGLTGCRGDIQAVLCHDLGNAHAAQERCFTALIRSGDQTKADMRESQIVGDGPALLRQSQIDIRKLRKSKFVGFLLHFWKADGHLKGFQPVIEVQASRIKAELVSHCRQLLQHGPVELIDNVAGHRQERFPWLPAHYGPLSMYPA